MAITKESIIEQKFCCENLPPAFADLLTEQVLWQAKAALRRQVTPLCPPGQRPYGPAAKEGNTSLS